MSKRANPMAVKSSLTYTVEEAAHALGKSPATIRNWIRDGLPVMASRKPMLMLGGAIRGYLQAKYKSAKRPLVADELFCLSCQIGRKPLHMTVLSFPNTAKTTRLKGTCEQCGGAASRIVSNTQLQFLAATFQFKERGHSEA